MAGFWQDLMIIGVPAGEKIARTIIVYLLLIVGLRIFGKRELSHLNPLDFIVLLLLSNTVQNAIIGADNSLAGGLLGAAVLFLVNWAVVRVAYKNPRFRRVIDGTPDVLVRDGQVLTHVLERNSITRDELITAAREQGIQDLHDVETARLEVDGALTFSVHEAMTSERFRAEVLERLAAIERRLPAAVAMLLVVGLAAVR